MTPREALAHYFGLHSFREPQAAIIDTILSGKDVLALLPTGSGKSLCFQIPALLLPNLTLVISPLIALMEDQVMHLTEKGIQASYLSSQLTKGQQEERICELRAGRIKILYCTPERLQHKQFQAVLAELSISQVVIDEAHCISEWGHDFRPEYTQIPDALSFCKVRPIISAFTATATKKTVDDIVQSLKQNKPEIFSLPPIRNNLMLNILPCTTTQEKNIQLLRLLQNHSGQSGVIYVATRAATVTILDLVSRLSPDIENEMSNYHGGMSFDERKEKQSAYMSGKVRVLVGTTAFGMGIDKPDVRFVIHYHPPASIEQYYQEVGRAGRDGELATGYVLLQQKDTKLLKTIHLHNKSPATRKPALSKLLSVQKLFAGSECLTTSIARYFSKSPEKKNCTTCDRCNKQHAIEPLIRTLSRENERKILQDLQIWRKNLASGQALYHVATDAQLLSLALIKPATEIACQNLPGFGRGWCSRYWQSLQACMVQYKTCL